MTNPPPSELPNELKAFIYSCIDAVEQVEMLSLLAGAAQPLTTRAVAGELGIADPAARHHLETLTARGLLQTEVAADVRYRYAPKSADLRRYADDLVRFYGASRTTILRFIASSPRRVKGFSDAFKLRDPD